MASGASGTGATAAASAPTAAPAANPTADKKPEDDADEEVYADETDPNDEQINETAMKLHRYLANMQNVSMKQDYEHSRNWKCTVAKISFTNESDSKASIFLGFALTDDRPASKMAVRCHGILSPSTPQREISTITNYTPVIRDIMPQQQVFFPGSLLFRDWFSASTIRMSYRDILKRGLRVEVWERHEYAANVLLGTCNMTLSSIVHSPPMHAPVSIARNVAPTSKGRSTNVGSIGFSCTLEEAQLQHRIRLKNLSVCVSNQIGHPDFRHPCSCSATWPCICSGFTCCCDSIDNTLQLWGFGESLHVSISLAGGSVVGSNGKVSRRTNVLFRTPAHSGGMAAAASTVDHPESASAVLESGHKNISIINDSTTFATLDEARENEALQINCSRSSLEEKVLSVQVRLKCRRCFSEGQGKASIPLSGVTASSFLPFNVPIVFNRIVDGVCGLWVTAGILRGFLLWDIGGAPLMHHFTQSGGGLGVDNEESSSVLSLLQSDPRLAITVQKIEDLPQVHRDGTVDCRVTITWGGSTRSTTSTLGKATLELDEKLNFALPQLAGRSPTGAHVDASSLLLPLEVHRYALIRVWDDPSYTSLQSAGGIGRMTRRTELIAEALVELPFEKMLGVTVASVTSTSKATCVSATRECFSALQSVVVSGLSGGHKLVPVALSTALVVPGANSLRPTIHLSLSLEHLPLQNLSACKPQVTSPTSVSLLPDFGKQVHEDVGYYGSTEAPRVHVSAPGDVLQNPAAPPTMPLSKQSEEIVAKQAKTAEPVTAKSGMAVTMGQARTADGLPGCLNPQTDLSHSTWWSLLLRMVEVSNQSNAVAWWQYLTPGGMQRARDAERPAEEDEDEDERAIDHELHKLVAGTWNESAPMELFRHHISPLLYAIDENGIKRSLPSLLSPLPVQILLTDMASNLRNMSGSAFSDLAEVSTSAMLPPQEAGKTAPKPDQEAPANTQKEAEADAWDLASRACTLVAAIEFVDSALDVQRIRTDRGLVDQQDLDPLGQVFNDGAGIDETTDTTKYFAGIVYRSLQNKAWLSPSATLSLRRGGVAEHAALLCSMLLGLGLDAYFCIGTISSPDNTAATNARQLFLGKIAALTTAGLAKAGDDSPSKVMDTKGSLASQATAKISGGGTTKYADAFSTRPKNLLITTQKSKYDPDNFPTSTLPLDSGAGVRLGIGPSVDLLPSDAAPVKSPLESRRFSTMRSRIGVLHVDTGAGTEDPTNLPGTQSADVPAVQVEDIKLDGFEKFAQSSPLSPVDTKEEEQARRHKANLLGAQMDTVVRLLSESLHYFVVVFHPTRIPGRLDLGEPERVTVYDVDGTSTVVKMKNNEGLGEDIDGVRVVASSTGVQYRRILLLANNNNLWVNNQNATDVPKQIFEGDPIEAHTKGVIHRPLSRPAPISFTQFNLQQPNMWLPMIPEVAATGGKYGGLATQGGSSGDAFAQSSSSKLIKESPLYMHVGPGLGLNFFPESLKEAFLTPDTGGQKFFPGQGLDGTLGTPPVAFGPFVKRDLSDMDLDRLTQDIRADLNDAIINKRTFRKLSTGVVSTRIGYKPVIQRLQKLLIAQAALDLYAPGSDGYKAAENALIETVRGLKAMVPSNAVSGDALQLNAEGDDGEGTTTMSQRFSAADRPGQSITGGTQTSAVSSSSRRSTAGGGGPPKPTLDSNIRIYKVNGANSARIKRVALKDETYYMKPAAEIAVTAIVQQLMSGVFVTRVAIMSVFSTK